MSYYHYRQNNSFGFFQRNDNVDINVIIEACNGNYANEIAESIGIYFNGVESGYDCPCCGDRWYQQLSHLDDGDSVPSLYGEPIGADDDCIIIYYLNGDIIRIPEKE